MSKTVHTENYVGEDRREDMLRNLRLFYTVLGITIILVTFVGWALKTNWVACDASEKSTIAMNKANENEKSILCLTKDIQKQSEMMVAQTTILEKIDRRIDKFYSYPQ